MNPNRPLADEREFVITRTFDAPRDLVYRAWTEPKHMAQWWGPHHFTNPICEMDVRPGGRWRIVMRDPAGNEHPAKGEYREVVPPERLVWTIDHSELSDEWHALVNPSHRKGDPRPAIEVVNTVTFDDVGGKTQLTIRLQFESAQARAALVKLGMSEGWSQSLERLTNELALFTKKGTTCSPS